MSFKVDKVHFRRSTFWSRCLDLVKFSSQNYSKVQIARPPTFTILDQASTLHFFTEYFFVRCFFLIFVRFWFETYTFTWQSPLMKKAHWKNWKSCSIFCSVSTVINNLNSNLDIGLMGKSQVPDLDSNQCPVVLSISCLNQFAIARICERIQISVLY